MLGIVSVFVSFIVLSCLPSFVVFFSYQCILFDTVALNNRPYTYTRLDLRNPLSIFNLAWFIGVSFAKDQKSFEDCCCFQDLPYFLMRVERGWWQKVEGRHPKTVSSSNPNRLTQCGRRAVIEHILW